jgi:NADPH:quinone reductase-like Zn-dependent oxidoreductase
VQIAKSYGPEVSAVTSPRNIDLVRSLGADHVIDYTSTDFVRTGRHYDLILDTVGNRSARDLRRALAVSGRAAVVGFTSVARLMGVATYASRRRGVITIGTENISENSAALPNNEPIRSVY